MNVTIFSKDRACQLELLLRSIRDFTDIGMVEVIGIASDEEYSQGYEDLFDMGYKVNYRKEVNFNHELIYSINPDDPYTMFLTDDAFFTDLFSVKEIHLEEDTAAHSLLLGRNIIWAYELIRDVTQPSIPKWVWKDADVDFNYPMGVIGNIWRTSDILPKLIDLDYHHPCYVEGELASHPINKPYMTCNEYSRVAHIANNKVNFDFPHNKCGGGNPKDLNDKFLNGERIVLEKIRPKSVHSEMEYKFERME